MATVVSFHAHPDDEVLLTGGYLAARAAAGDRVVLVVATDGEAGLADPALGTALGATRRRELAASADALGVARVVRLGYADSGMAGAPTVTPGRFAEADPYAVAPRLAAILDEEEADVLTGYDPRGGYGHPDHVQVHRVARLARELAERRPQLLEATRDRTWLLRLTRLARPFARWLPGLTLPPVDAFCDPSEITDRVDVRPFLAHKRRALAAHASQAGGGIRTLDLLLRLPRPLALRVLGEECFVAAP